MGRKPNPIRSDVVDKPKPKRKQYNAAYNHYKEHLKSKEFKEVKKIVKERDQVCQFCGRTEEELVLKNGKKLTWNIHHLPQGYLHIDDTPEEEAKYCRLYCSACHKAAHQAPANRNRFTAMFTTKISDGEQQNCEGE